MNEQDEQELAAWHTNVTPEKWVRDQKWSHPDPGFVEGLGSARRRTEAAPAIVASLAELRRAVGLDQTELGDRWGRSQSYVSRVERDPAGVEMATMAGYVRAQGGRLTLTVEADGHAYHEDLVTGS